MPDNKLDMRIRIEELPTIALFLRDAFQRDLADFTAYIPDFNTSYVDKLNTKMDAVNAIINPKTLTDQLKLITNRISTNRFALQDMMSLLEGYVKRAGGLTVPASDFGIKEVRANYAQDDQEGLDDALKTLLQNIAANFSALEAKGYTAAKQADLQKIKDALKKDNGEQNLKQDERDVLVENNYTLMNELWNILMDISDAGKRIYKVQSPAKLDDYTVAALKRRMRQEQKNTRLWGIVTLNGEGIVGKVVMKPVAGGRSRSARCKMNGIYEIKGSTAGNYLVTATAEGHAPKTDSVTIVSGENVELNFELA